jgi:hypothetical protein
MAQTKHANLRRKIGFIGIGRSVYFGASQRAQGISIRMGGVVGNLTLLGHAGHARAQDPAGITPPVILQTTPVVRRHFPGEAIRRSCLCMTQK